jgi:hypothetical protein
MPFSRQLAPEFPKVIDLSIVSEPDFAVFVGYGLLGGGSKIDDAESLVTQRDGKLF